MTTQRSNSLDIFRVLCCFGVICYHTFDDVLYFESKTVTASVFAYFIISFCVCGFFMLSGYLAGKKNKFTVKYSANKIFFTCVKYSFWLVIAAFFRYFSGREFPNLVQHFVKGLFAAGCLPVAWFLLTYMILMAFAVFLHPFMAKFPVLFTAATAALLVFVAIPCDFNIDMLNRPQSMWLPLYTTYFMTGMLISHIGSKFDFKSKKLLFCGINIAAFAVYMYKVFSAKYLNAPAVHYGRYYYTIWLVSLFIIVLSTDISNRKISRAVEFFAKGSFTVYMLHLPVLLALTAAFPLENLFQAIIVAIGLFALCQAVSALLRKIPYISIVA